MPSPTSFIVDGFNLYHSVRDAGSAAGRPLKWLDIRALCESYLPHIGRDATLEGIYYFSALAHHLAHSNPGAVQRHRVFLRAIEDSGVVVTLGRFKAAGLRCKKCRRFFQRYEEKETDVALAAKMFELLARDRCETVVIVSGDTDPVPAVTTARGLYPTKGIRLAFPYGRHSDDLRKIATGTFKMKVKAYERHQFPDPLILKDGTSLAKPSTW